MPDYSLDPYQAEESNILDVLKSAMAQKLRQRPAMEDLSARALYAGAEGKADRDIETSMKQRTELADRAQAALLNTLRQYGPEVQNLGANPFTRSAAIKSIGDEESIRLDEKDRAIRNARMQAQSGGQEPYEDARPVGGALPTTRTQMLIAQALDDAQSGRESVRKRGEAVLKAFQGQNPRDMVRLNASGGVEEIPGAFTAYQKQVGTQQQQQHPAGIKVPSGEGDEMNISLRPKERGLNFYYLFLFIEFAYACFFDHLDKF